MPGSDPGDTPGLQRNAPLHVDVLRRSPLWAEAETADAELIAALNAAHAAAGGSGACEVALILTDDAEIRRLNAAWRETNTATNVLAFPARAGDGPGDTGETLLGDVVLAYETVAREARERGLGVAQHACHLAIHGLLHLAGYDHDGDESAAEMEGLESRILATLGLHDPYSQAAG